MSKKNINKQRYYDNVRRLAYDNYCGCWKEVWAKWVYPTYPMSYDVFLRIIHKKNKGDEQV